MAELAIGIIGLAGLFTTGLQAFELLSEARSHGEKYMMFVEVLELERLRFFQWGKGVGLYRDARLNGEELQGTNNPHHHLLSDPEVRKTVAMGLRRVINLLEDSEALKTRYSRHTVGSFRRLGSLFGRKDGALTKHISQETILGSLVVDLRVSAKEKQKRTSISRKALWTISDHSKSQTLLQDLEKFINLLEKIVPIPTEFLHAWQLPDTRGLDSRNQPKSCVAEIKSHESGVSYQLKRLVKASTRRGNTPKPVTERTDREALRKERKLAARRRALIGTKKMGGSLRSSEPPKPTLVFFLFWGGLGGGAGTLFFFSPVSRLYP